MEPQNSPIAELMRPASRPRPDFAPGKAGDIAKYCASIFGGNPHMQYAQAATIAAIQGLAGNRYRCHGHSIGDYWLIAGPPTFGKSLVDVTLSVFSRDWSGGSSREHEHQAIIVSNGFTGKRGVVKHLYKSRSALFHWEEMGNVALEILNARQNSPLMSIFSMLKSAYMLGNDKVQAASGYSDDEKGKDSEPPNDGTISMIGDIQDEGMFNLFASKLVGDGFLSRMNIVRGMINTDAPVEIAPYDVDVKNVGDAIRSIQSLAHRFGATGCGALTDIVIERDAQLIYSQYRERHEAIKYQLVLEGNSGFSSLISRSSLHVLRTASALAVADAGATVPKIMTHHMQWAIDFTDWNLARMASLGRLSVMGPSERRRKIILDAMSNAILGKPLAQMNMAGAKSIDSIVSKVPVSYIIRVVDHFRFLFSIEGENVNRDFMNEMRMLETMGAIMKCEKTRSDFYTIGPHFDTAKGDTIITSIHI